MKMPKVLCKRQGVYIVNGEGLSVELQIGLNEVTKSQAEKLIARGLCSEPVAETVLDTTKETAPKGKKATTKTAKADEKPADEKPDGEEKPDETPGADGTGA